MRTPESFNVEIFLAFFKCQDFSFVAGGESNTKAKFILACDLYLSNNLTCIYLVLRMYLAAMR